MHAGMRLFAADRANGIEADVGTPFHGKAARVWRDRNRDEKKLGVGGEGQDRSKCQCQRHCKDRK